MAKHRPWKNEVVVKIRNKPFVVRVFSGVLGLFNLFSVVELGVSLQCFMVCFPEKRTPETGWYWKEYFYRT